MPRVLILASISKAFRNFSFELLEALRNAGWEVVISIPDDPVNSDFENIGCRVVPSPLNRHGMNPLKELLLLREYTRLFRTVRPDAVLTYTIKPNLYGGLAARMFRVPFLATVTGLGTVFYNRSFANSIIRTGLKFSLQGAKTLFFQNSENLRILKNSGFVTAPYRLVSGSGVNLERRPLLHFPCNNGKVRFLMPARAQREKGVFEFLEAAERIRKSHPECEFHFAGLDEEPDASAALRDAQTRGIIFKHEFLNFNDMQELLKTVQAILLPSWHEGMSNVLLEGAAAGRVLLSSDIPGCRETMIPGETGLLFRAKSADAIVETIERFFDLSPEQRKAMGIEGRRFVQAKFDRKTVVAAYMDELSKIVNPSGDVPRT